MTVIPKTAESWTKRGYLFHKFGTCDACLAKVEFWWTPGPKNRKRLIPIDTATMEAHFASCPQAKEFRAIAQQVQA
jgi:hypothetical protein